MLIVYGAVLLVFTVLLFLHIWKRGEQNLKFNPILESVNSFDMLFIAHSSMGH